VFCCGLLGSLHVSMTEKKEGFRMVKGAIRMGLKPI